MYTVEEITRAGNAAKLSYWQLDVLLKSLEKLQKTEPQQLLQQTPCTTHVCRCDAHTFYDWELEANKCSTCDGLIRQIA